MRRLLLVLLLLVVGVGAVALVNASKAKLPAPPATRAAARINADSAAQRLAAAIRFPTITREDGVVDSAAFRGLHAYLAQSFPRTHAALTREVVNGVSLLYTWKGKDTTLAPVVLMGHLDVVPVIPGTEAQWTYPAFDGVVKDGFIWGRGTLDDKETVLGVLEAVEHLVAQGFVPARTVLLAFGHDEEGGGNNGAPAIVARVKALGYATPALVLDEGGAVMEDRFPGVKGPVALVGVAEKGFVTLELTATGKGGHSSTPPAHTQIGRLARAVAALEATLFPDGLNDASRAMLEALAPAMPFGQRMAMTNLWLTQAAVRSALLKDPATAAMLRTTTAPTIIRGGAKDNVLPQEAIAKVNFRIAPGETVESVIAYVQRVIADSTITVKPSPGFQVNPSPVSRTTGSAFRLVSESIRESLGNVPPLVVPYLVVGGTDSRFWSQAGAPDVFRFSPIPFEQDALQRVHGTDERIAVDGYAKGIAFFVRLLQGLDALL
jgi:carboxypeptidase PM20D1